MYTIPAIQTKYRGHQFRSKLEARWAVFLDTAKMRWEYEPERFNVNGISYLPDFYLTDMDCYFEVKGIPEYNFGLLQNFAWLIQKPLIVAEGHTPNPDNKH